MIRVTLVPGAGSDGPRPFVVARGPDVAQEGGQPPRAVTRFVTRTGRIVRAPHSDVVKVEQRPDTAPDGSEWTNEQLEVGWKPVVWPPATRAPAASAAREPKK